MEGTQEGAVDTCILLVCARAEQAPRGGGDGRLDDLGGGEIQVGTGGSGFHGHRLALRCRRSTAINLEAHWVFGFNQKSIPRDCVIRTHIHYQPTSCVLFILL
jgi:hypothetical protein